MVLPIVLAAAAVAKVNVWLLPHAHCDVGWQSTFDDLGRLNVSRILDTVTTSLMENKDRRFSWSEVAFLEYWWKRQTPVTQAAFKELIKNGQIEFVDGGWSQHDMGCTDYDGMFNNMETGHLFLRDTFSPLDVRPRVGWSLDPFGVSSTQAVFYALMGMDSYVYTRLPKPLIDSMKKNRSLEFLWEASSSLPARDTAIMSHVLESYYCMPNDFRFDMSAPTPTKAAEFAKLAIELTATGLERAEWFRTSNVLIPWGCDYMYQNASGVYLPTEEVMRRVNENTSVSGVSVRYGTPSEYLAAVRAEKAQNFPVAQTYPAAVASEVATNGDFFPYIPNTKKGAWSGYFTSRTVLKRLSRAAHSDLYVAERLAALEKTPVVNNSAITAARRDLGVVQHHDAITGSPCSGPEGCMSDQVTGEHDVLENYERMCTQASERAAGVTAASLGVDAIEQLDFGNRLLDGQNATMIVHNPVAMQRTETVEVKIPLCSVAVSDAVTGAPVASQVSGDLAVPDGDMYYFTLRMLVALAPFETRSFTVNPCVASKNCLSKGRTSDPCYAHPESVSHKPLRSEVHRRPADPTDECPALNAVDPGDVDRLRHVAAECDRRRGVELPQPQKDVMIENKFLQLVVDPRTGPKSLMNKTTGKTLPFRHELVSYENSEGNAYYFQPAGAAKPILGLLGAEVTVVVDGKVFSEVRMKLSDEHRVWYRLWQSDDEDVGGRLEIGYRVGVINQNSNLASRLTTSINNGGVAYTESNGYEVLRRRPDTSFSSEALSIPANFFPSQMSFFIRDESNDGNQLSVAVDRSRAVASLGNGQAEMLLHRRLMNTHSGSIILDDASRVTARTWVSLAPVVSSNRRRQEMKLRMAHPITVLFSAESHAASRPPVPSLPRNVHLQTLKLDSNGAVLLRLMHIYASGEDPVLSNAATVDITPLFAAFGKKIGAIVETTASGMVPLSAVHRPSWNNVTVTRSSHDVDPTNIVMEPKAVRTFSLTLA